MSKKTKTKIHYKKHRTNKKYTIHHTKRHYKKHRNRTNKKHTRRHYKKKRNIVILPGSKGVPLFIVPEKTMSQPISVDQKQFGNIIPGLRNM